MISWFFNLQPTLQAFLATLFTWALTALGAALVFIFKSAGRSTLNALLGFAAGVMVAASFWSLLAPAIEIAQSQERPAWLIAAVGFLGGGFFLYLIDQLLPHLHLGLEKSQSEGIQTSWQRSILLVLAVTLHNIPEGLAVGVAFGAAALDPSASLAGAITLALGIGLQNFPEGAAVSLPLRGEGLSPAKSFFYGQASAAVEPVAAVLGAAAVLVIQPILPYALSFAAGAMIYVVVEELIPEAQLGSGGSKTDIGTIGFIFGFTLMMILDVALG